MFGRKGKFKAYKLKLELQKNCWENIGPARTEKKLNKMVDYLEELDHKLKEVIVPEDKVWNQQFIDLVELRNMIDTAKSVALASLKRDKSLGGHVRLDKKTSSLFSKPYSTLIKINNNDNYKVSILNRESTTLKRIIFYKLAEQIRLIKARILRYLPQSVSDIIIENKYKKILGTKVLKIEPGSIAAAPGEKFN
tara:strand:+ start:45 stop:626 length:582 start_codon:yes stop_codon:yes gene_type:complete